MTKFRIPGMKSHVVFQLVKFLWTTILDRHYTSKEELHNIIDKPSRLIFDAAEVGNFGFLSELISAHPSLIWEVNDENRTILHIAVLHRHASIFNVVHQIGHIKDIIVTFEDDDRNNLLHLAAKLAPPDQLGLVSGAAFQMCVELVWFEVQYATLLSHFHLALELVWVGLCTYMSKRNRVILTILISFFYSI